MIIYVEVFDRNDHTDQSGNIDTNDRAGGILLLMLTAVIALKGVMFLKDTLAETRPESDEVRNLPEGLFLQKYYDTTKHGHTE